MGATLDQRALADLLPGTWTIAATNFPMWLTGEKTEPRFTYELVSEQPLVLSDDVGYAEEGEEKHILGQDTWRDDEFVWRGRKLLRLFASRWSVAGMSDDGSIAVIRFSKSLVSRSRSSTRRTRSDSSQCAVSVPISRLRRSRLAWKIRSLNFVLPY